jgi:signal transduction histidine kinase
LPEQSKKEWAMALVVCGRSNCITRIETKTLNLNKEEVNINDIILTAMDDLILNIIKDLKRDKIKLRYEPREDSILVKADRIKLTQVISNLLRNAIQFTRSECRLHTI